MRSTLLSQFPSIIHGYTTRSDGDGRTDETKLDLFGRRMDTLICMEQVHGSVVSRVTNSQKGHTVGGVDALVYKKEGKFEEAPLLVVHVADCVPLLIVDPTQETIAVVHAGWRGTAAHITQKTIKNMISLGSNVTDVFVSVGPHIGMCCYNVAEERAKQFLGEFNQDRSVAAIVENAWHVDLGRANYLKLIEMGIPPGQIDAPITCTSCQVSTYFSFRKDTKETFGKMLGFIGFQS